MMIARVEAAADPPTRSARAHPVRVRAATSPEQKPTFTETESASKRARSRTATTAAPFGRPPAGRLNAPPAPPKNPGREGIAGVERQTGATAALAARIRTGWEGPLFAFLRRTRHPDHRPARGARHSCFSKCCHGCVPEVPVPPADLGLKTSSVYGERSVQRSYGHAGQAYGAVALGAWPTAAGVGMGRGCGRGCLGNHEGGRPGWAGGGGSALQRDRRMRRDDRPRRSTARPTRTRARQPTSGRRWGEWALGAGCRCSRVLPCSRCPGAGAWP